MVRNAWTSFRNRRLLAQILTPVFVLLALASSAIIIFPERWSSGSQTSLKDQDEVWMFPSAEETPGVGLSSTEQFFIVFKKSKTVVNASEYSAQPLSVSWFMTVSESFTVRRLNTGTSSTQFIVAVFNRPVEIYRTDRGMYAAILAIVMLCMAAGVWYAAGERQH